MIIEKELYSTIQDYLPISCVDVIIQSDGKVLLLKRDNEPAKGQFWFPGGRIFKNESILNAALRKAKEETSLDCVFNKIVSVEESIFSKEGNQRNVHTINICCLLTPANSFEIKVDKLHSAFKWINQLDKSYRNEVNNPLALLGYKFFD